MGRVDAKRVANLASVVGCVWFALAAFWGVGRIPGGGHIGAGSAGTTLLAESSLHWHTIYPILEFFPTVDPYPVSAYCHHPFGMYWMSMLALRSFGHHDLVVFLPAAIQSALTPVLLHGIARRVWGPIAAAGAVLGFVFIPLVVGFSDFHNLEVITIFGATLFCWGWVVHLEKGRVRHLLAALAGAFIAGSGDWVGFLVLGPILFFALLRGFILPRGFTPGFPRERYHRLWALSVTVSVATLFLFVALFQRADKIGDWLGSATQRGSRDTTPLAEVLETRKTWVEFSFTPLVIAVGKVGAWVAAARLLLRRRDEEVFSLAVLAAASVQYVVFRQGADIHIFWPHYYGLYYAFAFAQLVASVEWLVGRFTKRAPRAAPIVALVVAIVIPALAAPDTVRSLHLWRATGGRYDDKGSLIRTHVDLLFVLEKLVRPYVHWGDRVAAHGSASWGWEHPWAAACNADGGDGPDAQHRFWVGRASGMGSGGLRTASKLPHLRIYGDVLFADRDDAPGPLDAYDLHEREPGPLEWYFTNPTDPVRTIDPSPDAFLTWEWRDHLGVSPAEPPTGPADTLPHIRILHNAAVARGDGAEAERLRQLVTDQLDRTVEAHWEGDHTLVGVRRIGGVEPRLEMWFESGGATASDTSFNVTSQIVAKSRLSWIPQSDVVRQMAWPPTLPTSLWKKGYLYVVDFVLNHRIGVERYVATWAGGPARRPANARELVLVTLP